MKRLIALLLATVMLATLFAGCKKNPEGGSGSIEWEIEYEHRPASGVADGTDSADNNADPNTPASSGGTIGGQTQTNKGDTNLEGNTYKSGFPIVKNKETLSIMLITRADVGDITKSQFTSSIKELTNIELKYQFVSEGEAKQRKTIALQSGNVPNIFALGRSYLSDDDIVQYGREGVIKEITKDMLNTWAPNIVDTYNQYPDCWKFANVDGKMYTIASLFEDLQWGQHVLWVRKSWLSKLGLGIPKTMDEFYNMLVAFKNNDPNGNGQKDEVPYAMWQHLGFSMLPWGFYSPISVDNNGKVHYMYTTTNMKDAVTYWAKVYKEGLVDKKTINNYSGNNAAFKTLVSGGKVGAFYYGNSTTMLDEALQKDYEAIPWPSAGDNGNFPSVGVHYQSIVSGTGFAITKSCKNVPAALRFIDYLYTNDGFMLKKYGNAGGVYTKVNDTTYKPTGKTAEQSTLGPDWTMHARHFLVGATYEKPISYGAQVRLNLDKQNEQIFKQSGQKYLPKAIMSKSETNNLKKYETYFDSVSNKYYEFIKGTLNMGSDWTTMVNEMKNKGADKYVEVYQSYYDRINK